MWTQTEYRTTNKSIWIIFLTKYVYKKELVLLKQHLSDRQILWNWFPQIFTEMFLSSKYLLYWSLWSSEKHSGWQESLNFCHRDSVSVTKYLILSNAVNRNPFSSLHREGKACFLYLTHKNHVYTYCCNNVNTHIWLKSWNPGISTCKKTQFFVKFFLKIWKFLCIALKLCMSVLSNYIFQLIYLHENFHFPRAAVFHCKNIPLEKCYQCSVLLRARIDNLWI